MRCNGCALAVTVGQVGVTLQWTRLFEPHAQNFVQYRKVANLTASASENDLATPYTTLAMSFMSGGAKHFTIPAYALAAGVHYEFRLGFPFPTYTYYTDTLIAKTFDAGSPFVNSIEIVASDVLSTVSWRAPEYDEGIVGYRVALLYREIGNGDLVSPQWLAAADGLQLVSSTDLPLTETSVTLGCADVLSSSCLVAYTTYLVQISVIRQSGVDSAKSVYFSTLHTQVSARNSSSMFLHGGRITMQFTVAVPTYNNVSIVSTFLWPLKLHNKRGDLALTELSQSRVKSISETAVEILLSDSEYNALVGQVKSPTFVYSSMWLTYGSDQASIVLQPYCLMLLRALHFRFRYCFVNRPRRQQL